MHTQFTHRISKGTRYNQIYVPKEHEQAFQVGDTVQITLLEKKQNLHYSKNLKKLSPFKERLIKDIFSNLSSFKEIDQVFIFGSFLTKKSDYNDIDIMVISDKAGVDNQAHEELTEELNLKFHIISLSRKELEESLKISPLTRSMLYYFVSNKPFLMPKDKEIEINHIRYLMMFPEDLLEVELDSESFYEALKRMICIKHFLINKEIAPDKIDEIIKENIDDNLLERIKHNKKIRSKSIAKLRTIIKTKLKEINTLLKNEQKRQY